MRGILTKRNMEKKMAQMNSSSYIQENPQCIFEQKLYLFAPPSIALELSANELGINVRLLAVNTSNLATPSFS